MKLAITAIFTIFLVTAIYSQPIGWVEQTSGVTTQLTSVSIVDDNNAWICGYAGVVLRTTNGGANWVSVSSAPIPPTLDLHSIYAIDATTALAAGSGTSSFLFRTSNGGANWTQVFTETGGFINSVQMGNSFAGFMMGDPVGGRWSLWGTTTGGLTWDSASFYLPQTGSDAGWNNSFFFDASAGVWFGTNNTRVYKSLTLVNWTTQPTVIGTLPRTEEVKLQATGALPRTGETKTVNRVVVIVGLSFCGFLLLLLVKRCKVKCDEIQ